MILHLAISYLLILYTSTALAMGFPKLESYIIFSVRSILINWNVTIFLHSELRAMNCIQIFFFSSHDCRSGLRGDFL